MSTAIAATLAARLARARARRISAVIVEPADEGFEIGEILRRQLLALGEVADQRGQAAVEQPVQQPLALARHVVSRGDVRHRASITMLSAALIAIIYIRSL